MPGLGERAERRGHCGQGSSGLSGVGGGWEVGSKLHPGAECRWVTRGGQVEVGGWTLPGRSWLLERV